MVYVYGGKQKGAEDPWYRKPAEPKPAAPPKSELTIMQPCGTNAAYIRHRKRGEAPCAACTEARREYVATWRNTPPEARRRPEAACGTYAGAVRHYRNKEPLCEPCADARRTYVRQRRAKKKFAAQFQAAYDAAMQAHPDNAPEGLPRRKELAREVELAAIHHAAEHGTLLKEAS